MLELSGAMIVSMVICYFIAKNRQANAVLWTAVGFLTGPIGIFLAFFFAKPEMNHPQE